MDLQLVEAPVLALHSSGFSLLVNLDEPFEIVIGYLVRDPGSPDEIFLPGIRQPLVFGEILPLTVEFLTGVGSNVLFPGRRCLHDVTVSYLDDQ